MLRTMTMAALTVAMGTLAAGASPASALTMQECSAKYKSAQTAGTLNGQKWNDFRKAECGASASAAPATTPAAAPAATPAATPAPAAPKPATTTAAAPAAKPATQPATPPAAAPVGNAVFPSAVAQKYSSESAGKARMHTCLDQYNANKAANGNGGMNWIAKGGGYYSECNKRLKG